MKLIYLRARLLQFFVTRDLVIGSVFDLLDLVHFDVALRLLNDLLGGFARQIGVDFIRADGVDGTARVDARIFADQTDDIQRHVTKVVDGTEAVSHRNGFPVFEPFDFQVGVGDRFQLAFKVSVVALTESFLWFQLG